MKYIIHSIFILLFLTLSISLNAQKDKILTINSDNFSNTISKGVILIDFWAPCGGSCINPHYSPHQLQQAYKILIINDLTKNIITL